MHHYLDIQNAYSWVTHSLETCSLGLTFKWFLFIFHRIPKKGIILNIYEITKNH